MIEFDKHYLTAEEYERRLQNYLNTVTEVNHHNEHLYGKSNRFALGVNQFADWDESEIYG